MSGNSDPVKAAEQNEDKTRFPGRFNLVVVVAACLEVLHSKSTLLTHLRVTADSGIDGSFKFM